MRKTGCFGWNTYSIDFEWPTVNDLMQMPKNISIKLAALKHKNYGCSDGFGAFQVVLSNGISSPVFTAKGLND